MNPWLESGLFAGGLALSFFMSGMESGVFALNRLRIRQLLRQGRTPARRLLHFLDEPESFLWTILVGNTLANFTVATLLVIHLQGIVGGNSPWFWVGYILIGFGVYVFCELLPKTLFRQFPNRLCLVLVRPFQVVDALLSPLVMIVEWFARWLLRLTGGRAFTGRLFTNRDELRRLMQESSGTLTSTERNLINRVLDLQNVTVAQIARPLAKAVTVTADAPVADVLALCREHHLSRLPVWTGTGRERRIAGVVTLKSLLHFDPSQQRNRAADFLKPALFLEDTTRLEEVLRRMQRSGHHLAIVLGPDQRERGMLTLQDVLRVAFGEVPL